MDDVGESSFITTGKPSASAAATAASGSAQARSGTETIPAGQKPFRRRFIGGAGRQRDQRQGRRRHGLGPVEGSAKAPHRCDRRNRARRILEHPPPIRLVFGDALRRRQHAQHIEPVGMAAARTAARAARRRGAIEAAPPICEKNTSTDG